MLKKQRKKKFNIVIFLIKITLNQKSFFDYLGRENNFIPVLELKQPVK